jgi:hypothetical protein
VNQNQGSSVPSGHFYKEIESRNIPDRSCYSGSRASMSSAIWSGVVVEP